ncbi:MAG: hypothetical protein DMF73_19685 [Acidobacteria bacterium]|nr:MAG: hypothetical protein DMF73_19685 [Acidobacteriota bacterium]
MNVPGLYQIIQRLWCNAFLRRILLYPLAECPEINLQDVFMSVKDTYLIANHHLMINAASGAEKKGQQQNC